MVVKSRKAVKLVESSGTMLNLRYEMRICFARWVAATQVFGNSMELYIPNA